MWYWTNSLISISCQYNTNGSWAFTSVLEWLSKMYEVLGLNPNTVKGRERKREGVEEGEWEGKNQWTRRYVSLPISSENASKQRDCPSLLPATPYTQLANIYLSGNNQCWPWCGEAETYQYCGALSCHLNRKMPLTWWVELFVSRCQYTTMTGGSGKFRS